MLRWQQMQSMAVWSIGTILGPLVAPALGGWLTDEYSWRWCFFVNAPVGILAFAGLAAFLPEDRHQRGITFDFFGFGMLAVAVGSLQLLLDRGQQLDWLNSTEILIEAGLTFLGLWLFTGVALGNGGKAVLQRAPSRGPHVPQQLVDRLHHLRADVLLDSPHAAAAAEPARLSGVCRRNATPDAQARGFGRSIFWTSLDRVPGCPSISTAASSC